MNPEALAAVVKELKRETEALKVSINKSNVRLNLNKGGDWKHVNKGNEHNRKCVM